MLNIVIIIKMFLKQQIRMLERFLKDHVTLKTGVMMLKIKLYDHRNKLNFKAFANRKLYFNILNCNNISQYYCFLIKLMHPW